MSSVVFHTRSGFNGREPDLFDTVSMLVCLETPLQQRTLPGQLGVTTAPQNDGLGTLGAEILAALGLRHSHVRHPCPLLELSVGERATRFSADAFPLTPGHFLRHLLGDQIRDDAASEGRPRIGIDPGEHGSKIPPEFPVPVGALDGTDILAGHAGKVRDGDGERLLDVHCSVPS